MWSVCSIGMAVSDLRWVALRYFNAAEPTRSENWVKIMTRRRIWFRWRFAQRWPKSAFGDLRNGLRHAGRNRDSRLLHVTDLAEAHLAALRYLDTGGPSDAFNSVPPGPLSSGIIAMVEKVSGRKVPVREVGAYRDPACLIADATKSAGQMGWRSPAFHIGRDRRDAWNWKVRSSPLTLRSTSVYLSA